MKTEQLKKRNFGADQEIKGKKWKSVHNRNHFQNFLFSFLFPFHLFIYLFIYLFTLKSVKC